MLDFSRFEVLTFDCYGTLIAWEDGILGSLRPIFQAHGQTVDDSTILQLYGDFEATAEQGDYRRYRDVLHSVVQQFGGKFGFVPSESEANSLAGSISSWEPWADSVVALRELSERFQLAIISNIDDDLFATTRPKLGVRFSEVITAEQARAYKPALPIFELALSRVGVPPERILHVGQSVYHDVVPARALGLSTVWVNRPSRRSGIGAVKPASGQPDLEVRSLAELAAAAAR